MREKRWAWGRHRVDAAAVRPKSDSLRAGEAPTGGLAIGNDKLLSILALDDFEEVSLGIERELLVAIQTRVAGGVELEGMLTLGEGDAIAVDGVGSAFEAEVLGGAAIGADLVEFGVLVLTVGREGVAVDIACWCGI